MAQSQDGCPQGSWHQGQKQQGWGGGGSPTKHNGQGDSTSLVLHCTGTLRRKWHVAATSSWS